MKIENTHIYGFQMALTGMRNAFNSWDLADSNFFCYAENWGDEIIWGMVDSWFSGEKLKHTITCPENPKLGPADLKLAKKLIRNGTDHRKFLRQIQIWVDFTVPRYVWQELDTYKVATVRNSCSTMHKLGHTDLTTEDFEDQAITSDTLSDLNMLGWAYRKKTVAGRERNGKIEELRGYDIVRYMKGVLPESFLQKATYTMSYETALSMYFARRSHKLSQWNEKNPDSICWWIKSLPYMNEFISVLEKK